MRVVLAMVLFLAAPALADSSLPPAEWADRQLPDPRQEAEAKALMEKATAGAADPDRARAQAWYGDPDSIRDHYVVPVRPEQVVEIALDGVQRSSRYPGGIALRFARVVRYRDDKSPAEADTIDTVRAFLSQHATNG